MVEFINVSKVYSDKIVLSEISCKIEQGECVLIRGRSGAGKSTMMRLIYMAEKPTKGVVSVLGFSSKRVSQSTLIELRKNVGYISQGYTLMGSRTVFENISLPLKVIDEYVKERVEKILDLLELATIRAKKLNSLSASEYQLVKIGCALVRSPKILLADEPFSNLDTEWIKRLTQLFYRLKLGGMTIVFASSLYTLDFADKSFILNNGKII